MSFDEEHVGERNECAHEIHKLQDRLQRVRGTADLARAMPRSRDELYRFMERISEIAGEGER